MEDTNISLEYLHWCRVVTVRFWKCKDKCTDAPKHAVCVELYTNMFWRTVAKFAVIYCLWFSSVWQHIRCLMASFLSFEAFSLHQLCLELFKSFSQWTHFVVWKAPAYMAESNAVNWLECYLHRGSCIL